MQLTLRFSLVVCFLPLFNKAQIYVCLDIHTWCMPSVTGCVCGAWSLRGFPNMEVIVTMNLYCDGILEYVAAACSFTAFGNSWAFVLLSQLDRTRACIMARYMFHYQVKLSRKRAFHHFNIWYDWTQRVFVSWRLWLYKKFSIIVTASATAFLLVQTNLVSCVQLTSLSPSPPLVLTLLERPTAWCVLLLWLGQMINQLSSGWIKWTTQFPLRWSLQLVAWAHWPLIHWQPLMLGPTHVKLWWEELWRLCPLTSTSKVS